MKLPNIAPDDAALFGSLAAFAFGCVLIVGSTTASILLALGSGLVAFGLPAVLIVFLASAVKE